MTIDTFEPTSALISVDLPAFGAPIRATKPQRVALTFALQRSRKACAAACSAARLELAAPRLRLVARKHDAHDELRRVGRAAARDLLIVRRREARAPAPIPASRSWRRARARRPRHARAPGARDELARRLEAAVEKTAPIRDSQTSDEDRRLLAAAAARFAEAQHDMRPDVPFAPRPRRRFRGAPAWRAASTARLRSPAERRRRACAATARPSTRSPRNSRR